MKNSELPSQKIKVIYDFIHSLDDIYDFLVISRKRTLETDHIRIVLSTKLDELKDYTNNFSISFDLDPELKAKTLFEAIPKFNSILNLINPSDSLRYIWLELNSLSNMIIVSLITIHSKGDIWSIQASSNLIVKILLGIPRIPEVPPLPSPIDDPFAFRNNFALAINTLQFTALVFYGVVDSLPTIHEEDLIKWANNAFWHYKLIFSMNKSLKWEEILTAYKRDVDRFYLNISLNATVFINVVLLCFTLFQKFKYNWPQSIDTQGFLYETNMFELNQLCQNMKRVGADILTKLNDLYNSGLIPVNDNPINSQDIQEIHNINKSYDFIVETNIALDKGLKYMDEINKTDEVLLSLEKALELAYWYNSYLEFQSGENILGSEAGEEYITQLVVLMELWSLKAIWTNDRNIFYDKIKEYDWILSKVDSSKFPELAIKKLLVELFLDTKLKYNINLKHYRDQFATLNFLVMHRPRDLFSVTIMEAILSYYLQDRPTEVIKLQLLELKDQFFDYGQIHLLFDYDRYINYIFLAIKDKEVSLDLEVFVNRMEVNIFDSYSWFIPTFDKIAHDTNLTFLIYVPFNRKRDSVALGMSNSNYKEKKS